MPEFSGEAGNFSVAIPRFSGESALLLVKFTSLPVKLTDLSSIGFTSEKNIPINALKNQPLPLLF
ncbi:hypothetical protein [Lysinibacillus sp. fls2-241-R2A-57]|uniref:hypothetical protein n=1 Tax=Lysinibacillus sp. fls2-241-R2A-57 TaxID=3040292 RepID=UPI0025554CDF|nr:hypothetical protein [Lysinibacillus sp. fls2-241-R2A-57]